jgi:calcium/calmodulin-dependent protein kinase I
LFEFIFNYIFFIHLFISCLNNYQKKKAPPEMISSQGYNCCCDIWSLGVIAFECLSGHKPFEALSEDALFAKIHSGKLDMSDWTDISEDAKDFVSQMLTVNHKERPDAQSLLSHR